MRKICLAIFIVCTATWLHAQPLNKPPLNNPAEKKGNTYAVVIGISKYENLKAEDQLDFADRDADVFAEYLQSKAGGSVPAGNIQLLKNDEANYFAITNAIRWLVENCKEDDIAYFYFSGHGTLEDFFTSDDGYLLAYNSLPNNLAYNSIRIGHLNDMAKTLAKKNNGKVIVITDACHSGKLAGNEKKMMKASSFLRDVKGKDIRITSCATNELSNEDVRWGNGRSVFSYYLVKGLQQEADINNDGNVTVGEIKEYMQTSFKTDPVLAEIKQPQTPVINGADNFQLAAVNKKDMALTTTVSSPVPVLLAPVKKPAINYFFDMLKKVKPGQVFNFPTLMDASREQLLFGCLKSMYDSLTDPNSAISSIHANDYLKTNNHFGNYIDPSIASNDSYNKAKTAFLDKFETIKNTLANNQDAVKTFETKLTAVFCNEVQKAINDYISGDECEMEKRMYYNHETSGYDAYPLMLQLALRYIEPGTQVYNDQLLKMNYFKGVAIRLKLPENDNSPKLINEAIALQRKAMALENPHEPAAYIRNELGVLYSLKKNNTKAKDYFIKANAIAPSWTIPLANLIYQYTEEKKWKKANETLHIADSIKADFLLTMINAGYLYDATGNYLFAREKFHKATLQYPRYYLSYERLGKLYLNTLDYALSDSMYHIAFVRKKSNDYYFEGEGRHMLTPHINIYPSEKEAFNCPLNDETYRKAGELGQFAKAMIAYIKGDNEIAEKELRKLITIVPNHPLAWHYLGKILCLQHKWAEAEIMLTEAMNNYQGTENLAYYTDSLSKLLALIPSCIQTATSYFAYEQTEDYFLLGDVFEKMQLYEQAEDMYQRIINTDNKAIGGYYKLWHLMEKLNRYHDAEDIIKKYVALNNGNDKNANAELYDFYQRVLQRFPENADWNYKAANFLYYLALDHPSWLSFDTKEIDPLTQQEEYDFRNNKYFKQEYFNLPGIQKEEEKKGYVYSDIIDVNGIGPMAPPGTVFYASAIQYPLTRAIEYFKMADSIVRQNIQEDEMTETDSLVLADINNKIGDMYGAQELVEKSVGYFKRSLMYFPGNAAVRKKYINFLINFYEYKAAKDQLDTLYIQDCIDFDDMYTKTDGEILSGNFKLAGELITRLEKMPVLKQLSVIELKAKLQVLSNNLTAALSLYKEYLSYYTEDSIIMYNIARIYALKGQQTEAFQWLKKAMDAGFNYIYVLYYDKAWKKYSKLPQWTQLLQNYNARTYSEQE